MSDQLSSDLAALRIDRDASVKNRSSGGRGPVKAIVATVVVLGALGAAFVAAKPLLEATFFKTEVQVTEISVMSPAQASVELTSTGYVVPQTVTLVGAKIPGRVAVINVKEGMRVKQGDILLELDSADYQAALRASQTRVASAKARALASRASVTEIEVQLNREKRLVAENLSPKANVENLEARVAALEAQVKASEAEVVAAGSEVAQAQVNLGYLTIKSPIDGEVVSKPPQLGELVGALTLTPLTIEVADMATLAVETDVPESRLEQVKDKAPAEIVLDAYPSRRFRGEVLQVSPKINRTKATVKVKVRFVDSTESVMPEMAARVSFLAKPLEESAMKEKPKIVVPAAAIVDRNGSKVVYVVDGERVKMIPISVGPPFGSGFELTGGPPAGTKIVKNPPPELGDGMKVKEKVEG
jgi:RND family efflux transporter MFP subunit